MRNINELEREDLLYLKNKWSAEIQDFEDQIDRTERKLTGKLHRSGDSLEELEVLEQRLANATGILESIQSNGSIAPALIANQQAEVNALQAEHDERLNSLSQISAKEVQLTLMEIDNMQRRITARAEKIQEIETQLAA